MPKTVVPILVEHHLLVLDSQIYSRKFPLTFITKFISYITLSSSPLACLNGSLRNVAFDDDAVLSGGWFRDKDERVNAEKASSENTTRKKTEETQRKKLSFPPFFDF